MRHRSSKLRLVAKPSRERGMVRNLVTSLLLYERIRTTHKRAIVARTMLDHLVTVAKRYPPQRAVRLLNQVVTDRNASRKVMEVLKERFSERSSGFTRVVPVGSRKGDGARLVDWSLLEGKSARKTVKASKTILSPTQE